MFQNETSKTAVEPGLCSKIFRGIYIHTFLLYIYILHSCIYIHVLFYFRYIYIYRRILIDRWPPRTLSFLRGVFVEDESVK